MDFFKQLGEKLTNAGQNVAQQTKGITDVVRLNSEVSVKKRTITQLYAEIGRAYYERHKSDPDAEELQTISKICTLHEEIAQRQETIKQIKGVTKCPACGADVTMGSAFCSSCGGRMPAVATPIGEVNAVKKCPKCNADVDVGNSFCIFCGTKLD